MRCYICGSTENKLVESQLLSTLKRCDNPFLCGTGNISITDAIETVNVALSAPARVLSDAEYDMADQALSGKLRVPRPSRLDNDEGLRGEALIANVEARRRMRQ